MQFRRTKKNIDGIILLDKPIGYSSNQALQKVKHLFQAAKAGHTGTLDPLATGLLPLCLGEATKFAQYLTDANKTYVATLKLGQTTTTGDAEGEVLVEAAVDCDVDKFSQVCAQFVGVIDQTPPMYSALKHEGKPLYEYARAGIVIDRPSRSVTISEITVNRFEGDVAEITVKCSKGTYIRTLAEDIGSTIGCGSHLIGLRRTETANYDIAQTITLEQLEALSEDERKQQLHPVDSAIVAFPKVIVTEYNVERIRQGQTITQASDAAVGFVRMYDENDHFLGLGDHQSEDVVVPKRLIANPETFTK